MSTISVIIPAHNAAQWLAQAVESVRAQRLTPNEIIVVDDHSEDATAAIAREFADVQLHTSTTRGAGAARNLGVRVSRGEFLAFLDADDLWTPDKLARQLAEFRRDPSLEAVFGHAIEFIDGAGDVERKPLPAPVPGTMLIKREAFLRIGWFDEAPDALEGADWLLRAHEQALRSVMLPDVIYRRRLHGQNRSIVHRDLGGYVRAIKASLDRRRTHAESAGA